MDTERRQIPGYHGRYTIDKKGRVYSEDYRLKTYIDKHGYETIKIQTTAGHFKTVGIHRLIALAWVPGRDVEKGVDTVDHVDGNKQNNDPANLRWVTKRENGIFAAYEQGLLDVKAPIAVIAVKKDDISTYITFGSVKEAARALGLCYRNVYAVAHETNPHRRSVGGWAFMIA